MKFIEPKGTDSENSKKDLEQNNENRGVNSELNSSHPMLRSQGMQRCFKFKSKFLHPPEKLSLRLRGFAV